MSLPFPTIQLGTLPGGQPSVTLYCGDVLEVLRALPERSVQCVVTSPPYWGLRDYGTAEWEGGDSDCAHAEAKRKSRYDYSLATSPIQNGNRAGTDAPRWANACPRCGAHRIDQQLGLEATPEEYVDKLVMIFREVRRILRDDGVCFINLGDSYSSGNRDTYGPVDEQRGDRNVVCADKPRPKTPPGLKPKDLCGVPWRVAFALQADGWYLRSDIIWAKGRDGDVEEVGYGSPMPESADDRPMSSHEDLFLLTKNARYYYDDEAVRVDWPGGSHRLRDTWFINSRGYKEAHFAAFPERLVEPCILAGTSAKGCCPECGAPRVRVVERKREATRPARDNVRDETGLANRDYERHVTDVKTRGWRPGCECGAEPAVPCTVLDPFIGSGTTALVAVRHGCQCIGIDLSADYLELARKRVGAEASQGKLL